MRRHGDAMGRPAIAAERPGAAAAGLAALLLLAGCGDLGGPAIGRQAVYDIPAESLTVQRIRGTSPEVQPLTAEPGNMWPEEEAPRATLANPDEAMRGIPDYRPNVPPAAPPPLRPRGSSSAPVEPMPLRPDQRATVTEQPPLPPPPTPRLEGRPIPLPGGGFATGTGGTGNVEGLVTQGGGSGAVVNQGNTEVIILPDGRVEQRLRTR